MNPVNRNIIPKESKIRSILFFTSFNGKWSSIFVHKSCQSLVFCVYMDQIVNIVKLMGKCFKLRIIFFRMQNEYWGLIGLVLVVLGFLFMVWQEKRKMKVDPKLMSMKIQAAERMILFWKE